MELSCAMMLASDFGPAPCTETRLLATLLSSQFATIVSAFRSIDQRR
jgi:hypothetical protein